MTDLWERLRSRLATSSIAEADPGILDQLDSIVAPSQIEDVARWYRERGLIESDDPVPFERQLGKLGEEVRELGEALEGGDPAHIAKELFDVMFVAAGALVIHAGGEGRAAECWREGMRSNDSKPTTRDETGKIVKGPDFVAADMARVLGVES